MNKTISIIALAGLLSILAVVLPARGPAPQAPPAAPSPGTARVEAAPTPITTALGGMTLTLVTDRALVTQREGEVTVQVDVTSEGAPEQRGRPANMVLVLDRSGSMCGPKLAQAKAAARALVQALTPGDRFALVHFGSEVVVGPLRTVTPEARAAVLAELEAVPCTGGTNLAEALEAGRQLLVSRGLSGRVVLASDGAPTVGVVSPTALVQLAAEVRATGVTVSALGIGADYNGLLMTGLAEAGGGMYGYLRSPEELERVLSLELQKARAFSRRQVVLQLVPEAGVELLEVTGRQLMGDVVPLPDMGAGDSARAFVRLRTRSVSAGRLPLLRADLRWTVDGEGTGGAQRTTLTARAEAQATANPTLAEQSRDELVFANAVRARGAVAMNEVAAAMDRGDRALALDLLDNVRAVFGASADALAADGPVIQRTRQDITSGSADELKHGARALEKKGLKSFGGNNAY